MRSLPLLALLLFAMVVCTSAQSPPKSPRASQEEMRELTYHDGGRRRFQACNGGFLSDLDKTFPRLYRLLKVTDENNEAEQKWTVMRMNDHEVVLRGHSGEYIQHSWGPTNAELVPRAKEWEMLTPVKNKDGTWSFQSRWNMWLGAENSGSGKVDFQSENNKCQHWKLELW